MALVTTTRYIGGMGPRARRPPMAIITVHRDSCRMLNPRTFTVPYEEARRGGYRHLRDCKVCKPTEQS